MAVLQQLVCLPESHEGRPFLVGLASVSGQATFSSISHLRIPINRKDSRVFGALTFAAKFVTQSVVSLVGQFPPCVGLEAGDVTLGVDLVTGLVAGLGAGLAAGFWARVWEIVANKKASTRNLEYPENIFWWIVSLLRFKKQTFDVDKRAIYYKALSAALGTWACIRKAKIRQWRSIKTASYIPSWTPNSRCWSTALPSLVGRTTWDRRWPTTPCETNGSAATNNASKRVNYYPGLGKLVSGAPRDLTLSANPPAEHNVKSIGGGLKWLHVQPMASYAFPEGNESSDRKKWLAPWRSVSHLHSAYSATGGWWELKLENLNLICCY